MGQTTFGGVVSVAPDPGSFRDRFARIYHCDGRIIRVMSPAALAQWRAFAGHPLAGELVDQGLLIESRELPGGLPGVAAGPVLEHPRLPFVSYPYEWPFSLLKRAAMLHLDLLERLLPAGFILRDATPTNVMFRGLAPVFIDVGSIAALCPGDVWQGFRQFLRTMLYPLLLAAYRGVPYQPWLRGAGEEGLLAWQISRLLSVRDLVRPGVARYVVLTALLERPSSRRLEVSRGEIQAAGVPLAVLLANVRRLKHLVGRLARRPSPRRWLGYAAEAYGDAARDRKREQVRAALARLTTPGGVVWDLGCNTGEYAALASEGAGLVVALDEDEAVVEELSRRCEEAGQRNVLPLVMDFANPSPSQGWRGAERAALRSRGPADLVLALALMHHLVLGKGLPTEQVLDELADLGRHCLLEFIDPSDELAQRLRRDAGEGGNQLPGRETFEGMVRRDFRVRETVDLTPGRSLLLLESRRLAS